MTPPPRTRHVALFNTADAHAQDMPATWGCQPLRQFDVLLDHEIRRQPLDLEPRPRLERLAALELSPAHGGTHTSLDLALRAHTELLEERAHGEIESFFVHDVAPL